MNTFLRNYRRLFDKKYFFLVILLCVLCACSKEENRVEVTLSQLDSTLVQLGTEIYSDSQLQRIVQYNRDINKLNERYPIECIRGNDNIYRVSYLGDSSIAVILFDAVGNKVMGNAYSTLTMKLDFDDLNKGQSLEDVQKIDSKGDYSFLYTGRDDVQKVSTHYTKDGYLISIEYDAANVILRIREELV